MRHNTQFSEVAAQLAANGYRPVPIRPGTKYPGFDGWQHFTFAPGCETEYPGHGAGVLLGDVVGLDIDVDDPDAVAAIETTAREILHVGETAEIPRRIGREPRVLLPLRASVPFSKITSALFRMRSTGTDNNKVEVLADGQQFVAFAVHKDTKRPYVWNGGGDLLTIPRDQLPEITEAQARQIVQAAETILGEWGERVGGKDRTVNGTQGDLGPIPEGARNETLASMAGAMRRRGMTREAIEAALLHENAARCHPPLPDSEVRVIAGSVARYEPKVDAAASAMQEIARIAALPDIEYEKERISKAKELGVRTSALDRMVDKVRETITEKKSAATLFPEVEPWGQPVDGVALLTELARTFSRFVVLPAHAEVALALWTVFTYAHDCFKHSPVLLLRSATKRCGKTTLVALLSELTHRPIAASNLTPAVIYRVVEKHHPTLLIDEVDSFLTVSDELRGILNSGHTRATAMAFRIEEINGKRETVGFSTWAPKTLAMIGHPPATILDRAISIHMRRKMRGDKVEKRRHAAFDVEALRSRCLRWADDNGMHLQEARPTLPDPLNDRQADSWEPLLAIAERVGQHWAGIARGAAIALCEADAADLDQAELGEELLRDIRGLFDDRARREAPGGPIEDHDRISGSDMVLALLALDARPWSEVHRGRPITQNWLARRLSVFGILVKNVRFVGGRVLKGYQVEQFADAWSRYLPTS